MQTWGRGIWNQLLSGYLASPAYYGFNFSDVYTDFNYLGITSNLGNGWKLDDKVYEYRYWKKQNYNFNMLDKANGITNG